MSAIEEFKEVLYQYRGIRTDWPMAESMSLFKMRELLTEIEQLEQKVAALEKDRNKWRAMSSTLYNAIPRIQEHMHDNVQVACQEYRDAAKDQP